MKKGMKKSIIVLTTVVLLLCGSVLGGITVFAEGSTTYSEDAVSIPGGLLILGKDADAYDVPAEGANVVHHFAAGETVFLTGEEGDYKTIFYKGETLYIRSEDTVSATDGDAALQDELQEEMKLTAQADITYVDSFLRIQKSERNALIWKIVIAVLVVAIIAVSVVIGIRNSKNGDKK